MNMARRETGGKRPLFLLYKLKREQYCVMICSLFACYLEEIMRIRAEPKNYYAKNVTGSTGESVKK